jgi:spermidine synthase
MAEPNMEQLGTRRWSSVTFGITILVSAFLLFQVQPMVSKRILPWFGGSPAVWTTCMLFFQVVLFGGYVYAHLLQRWLRPRQQVSFHLGLAAVALLLLPIAPTASWKPPLDAEPTLWILLLLTCTVGLPYFALSATSPLVQAWFSKTHPGRSPYRLYALSNVGSLAALLSYPFVFEPAFELRTQSLLWSGAFALYAVLCAVTLVSLWKGSGIRGQGSDEGAGANDLQSPNLQISKSQNSSGSLPEGEGTEGGPSGLDRFRWVALPACASLMLLAATNHICQDVATVPFLWVMPLSLYLLSFIISFEHERWYSRRAWTAAVVFALMGVALYDYFKEDAPLGLVLELTLNFAALFFACMMCHGELARLKPNPRHLTEYYLMISAGGALGGVFVAVAAPLLFKTHLEWQIGVVASALLAVGLLVLPGRVGRRGIIAYATIAPLVAIAVSYCFFWGFDAEKPIDRERNFFGVVSVKQGWAEKVLDPEGNQERELRLVNGRIMHGCQIVDEAKRRWPTSYYGESSGVGRAILGLQKSEPTIRVGAIGLGVGTLAAYARPGDVFRFYEINEEVKRMAQKHFTYLSDCRGKCEIVMGDARLSLESELKSTPRLRYNVLVVDAFSGDAIPTHLLTREAFEVYRQHLAPGGVIAVHVSNRYLRLSPVVRTLAKDCGMQVSRFDVSGDENRGQSTSDWVLVTKNKDFLKANPSEPADWGDDNIDAPLWTDQYSNLFQILVRPSWWPRWK